MAGNPGTNPKRPRSRNYHSPTTCPTTGVTIIGKKKNVNMTGSRNLKFDGMYFLFYNIIRCIPSTATPICKMGVQKKDATPT